MRDELLKDLREKAEFLTAAEPLGIKNAFAETMMQAADAIEELICEVADEHNARLDAEERHRWVPVTERLPDTGEIVWAVYKNSLFPNAESHHKTIKYDGDMWVDENGYRYLTANITHWKHRDHLPEPPKDV